MQVSECRDKESKEDNTAVEKMRGVGQNSERSGRYGFLVMK